MEDVFRLCVLRSGPFDEDTPHLKLAHDTAFQRSLQAVTGTSDLIEHAKEKARDYIKNESLYIKSAAQVTFSREFASLATYLDTLVQQQNQDADAGEDSDEEEEESGDPVGRGSPVSETNPRAKIVETIKSIFGVGSVSNVWDKTQQDVPRLKDSIIVIKRLPEEHKRPIAALTRILLDIEFVYEISQSETFPASIPDIVSYRNRPLILPSVLELDGVRKKARHILATRLDFEKLRLTQLRAGTESLVSKYTALSRTMEEVRAIGPQHLHPPDPPKPIPAHDPPRELLPFNLALRNIELLKNLTALNQKQFEASMFLAKEGVTIDPARILDSTGALAANKLAERLLDEHKALLPMYPTLAWEPPTQRLKVELFQPSAIGSISESAAGVLKALKIPLLDQPVQKTVKVLQEEIVKMNQQFKELIGQRPDKVEMIKFGDQPVLVRSPMVPWSLGSDISAIFESIGAQVEHMTEMLALANQIQPSGDADLLIVKQQLLRYQGGDVAHIENVLKGESKKRENMTRSETQIMTFLEAEKTESSDKEQMSTERFETSKESKSQIQQESAAEASATVTGSYGPTVSFSLSAAGSSKNAQESAMNTASKYAKEIVDKSTARITERILERTQRTITNTVTELDSHEINNSFKDNANPQQIAGVYQWVNKVYEARVHNYGERKIYDFMIPEPAAFYIFSKSRRNVAGIEELPAPPVLEQLPIDITVENYQSLAIHYGVDPTTLPPYPLPYKWIHLTEKNSVPPNSKIYTNNVQVTIPEGYEAFRVRLYNTVKGLLALGVYFADYSFVIQQTSQEENPSSASQLFDMTIPMGGEFPVNITLANYDGDAVKFPEGFPFAVTVSFLCQNIGADDIWRTTIWKVFKLACETAQAQYDAKVAELRANAAAASQLFQIQGTNPLANMTVMRDEIKKSCISILTNSQFESFSAIEELQGSAPTRGKWDPDPSTFPSINPVSSFEDGSIVRFFEQAFEWHNMTFTLYPYFWARKATWLQRMSYEDPDPMFNRFLKAGYARVSLPVRPGFPTAVAHYLEFAEPWNGGELPPIGSDTYITVATETMEETGNQKEAQPPSAPWDVVVPTTLVKLRRDDELPRWKAVGDKYKEMEKVNGRWQVVPEE